MADPVRADQGFLGLAHFARERAGRPALGEGVLLEQPVLGAKILMELVLMLSQRLRQTCVKLVSLMEKEGN